jgi:putative FmdB family regulatory protein
MPIYAFQCQACGHAFERLQKLSDADPTACPDCGAEQVRRQLTAPTFRLAGGGWYETDFKKDGKRNLAEKGEGGGGGEGGKDAAKVDAKPEAKADAKPAVAPASAPAAPAKPAPASDKS